MSKLERQYDELRVLLDCWIYYAGIVHSSFESAVYDYAMRSPRQDVQKVAAQLKKLLKQPAIDLNALFVELCPTRIDFQSDSAAREASVLMIRVMKEALLVRDQPKLPPPSGAAASDFKRFEYPGKTKPRVKKRPTGRPAAKRSEVDDG